MGKLKNHAISKRYRWDQAHLRAAEAYASLSFDPDRQVGCVITKDDSVIACGWNGTPPGYPNECKDENGKTLKSVVHAEQNAINNAPGPLEGCTVYITLAPCCSCAKVMAAHGVIRVVYREPYKCKAGINFLLKNGIEVEQVNE